MKKKFLLAFAIAASGNFPALLMAIVWRRFSTAGAVASILTGTFGTLILIWLSPTIQIDVLHRTDAWFPLKNPALVTIPLAFVVGPSARPSMMSLAPFRAAAFVVGIVVSLLSSATVTDVGQAHHERQMHMGTTGD